MRYNTKVLNAPKTLVKTPKSKSWTDVSSHQTFLSSDLDTSMNIAKKELYIYNTLIYNSFNMLVNHSQILFSWWKGNQPLGDCPGFAVIR